MSGYTLLSVWATGWRARKEYTNAFDAGESSRAAVRISRIAVATTDRRVYIATTRRPGADNTDVETRRYFDASKALRASVRVVWIAFLVAVSKDTLHTVRADAILITRELYAVAADAMEASRTIVVTITSQVRNDREARRQTEAHTR